MKRQDLLDILNIILVTNWSYYDLGTLNHLLILHDILNICRVFIGLKRIQEALESIEFRPIYIVMGSNA